MKIRATKKIPLAQQTLEGAGVSLHRAFGFGDTTEVDPFLLLDNFRGDHPADYSAGFPWHPRRGIEMITYKTCNKALSFNRDDNLRSN